MVVDIFYRGELFGVYGVFVFLVGVGLVDVGE